VRDTPYTLAALKREFGAGIAAMVAEQTAIHRLRRRRGHKAAQVMATIRSADTRVVATMLADRLHNMQTIQFVPHPRRLRQAREVLDTYLPAAQELSMPAVGSQLQTLACAALISNQSLRPPRRRVIIALDIENSTSRSGPVKAELRTMLYELFDAALRAAGIAARRRPHKPPESRNTRRSVRPRRQTWVAWRLCRSRCSVCVHRGGVGR
jgi:GTP pyrophosphokinase